MVAAGPTVESGRRTRPFGSLLVKILAFRFQGRIVNAFSAEDGAKGPTVTDTPF
jgi:hypothetical protein